MKNTTQEIDIYLKELRLPTIRSTYEETAFSAQKEGWRYEQYLFTLAARECDERSVKRIERQLQESRLPLEKSKETFDFNRLPLKLRPLITGLMEGMFAQRKDNVLIFGTPGSGKTHLLCAIGQELVRCGKKVYFTACSLLVQDLLRAKKDLALRRLIKRYERYEVIIIDDIGYVQHSKQEMEVLFTLFAQRYERGSIMITSNLAFSQWGAIFKDPMVTAAAIDRLVHHSVIIELNLTSYRIEQAKISKGLSSQTTPAPMGAPTL